MNAERNNSLPRWLIIELGEDLNWWVVETSKSRHPAPFDQGVLDPRQVAYLVSTLAEYQPLGYRPEQLAAAFRVYERQAEAGNGRLRLVASQQDITAAAAVELFALPVPPDDDGGGAYFTLLEMLTTARIRHLNATHAYAAPCTTDEMFDELDAVNADRYFGGVVQHVFDEINEILEWRPAEWSDPDS